MADVTTGRAASASQRLLPSARLHTVPDGRACVRSVRDGGACVRSVLRAPAAAPAPHPALPAAPWTQQKYADRGTFRFGAPWDGKSTASDIETQLTRQGWQNVRVYMPHHMVPAGWPESVGPGRWQAEGTWNGKPSMISGVHSFWKKA